ncbi:hypothetical protein BIFANG_02942 [Bifidobacterium angulatum DSM 20098 = JCM 7096]|uniref:Uncharacterized protein n=1 Tax=Bifidobacterium angulatum DSM 20098 = JCM 7096 TaxID=518635 RepID=C4FF43_9BIFI|nr:hypothetical protein BIFANG_02942 [Bifidobacterium angulatum DSM 20098 = JCM 7096]BAQ96463.1 hypothetical protein BBAG_0841 [Bifidobacterium angulatum DSM 20098 = JCM 7096]
MLSPIHAADTRTAKLPSISISSNADRLRCQRANVRRRPRRPVAHCPYPWGLLRSSCFAGSSTITA